MKSGQKNLYPTQMRPAIFSLYLNFMKSDGFKASPSCGNSLHKKRPSGVTKDIIAITFIKKKKSMTINVSCTGRVSNALNQWLC